jgi:hypothetical protein
VGETPPGPGGEDELARGTAAEEDAMLDTKGSRLAPQLLGPADMAELLAAMVTHAGAVAELVDALAPRGSGAIMAELDRIASGVLRQEQASQALRWILPEIHAEIGRRFRAALA